MSELLDQRIKITETPRDAQQGLSYVISVEERAAYINALLEVGFDVIDFGSFVSPKAVPQMANQDKVLELVDKKSSITRLMAIVGNYRGGQDAAAQEKLDLIGFPFSLSETFMLRNINSTPEKALDTIDSLLKLSREKGKDLRIFMSMAFGNPYGETWDIHKIEQQIEHFITKGIKTVTLSDTIGLATPETITYIFTRLLKQYEGIEFGLHLHTGPDSWYENIKAAWNAGCRSFDGVLNGIGGCPMTGYELIGNLNTLNLIDFIKSKNLPTGLNLNALEDAMKVSKGVYA